MLSTLKQGFVLGALASFDVVVISRICRGSLVLRGLFPSENDFQRLKSLSTRRSLLANSHAVASKGSPPLSVKACSPQLLGNPMSSNRKLSSFPMSSGIMVTSVGGAFAFATTVAFEEEVFIVVGRARKLPQT